MRLIDDYLERGGSHPCRCGVSSTCKHSSLATVKKTASSVKIVEARSRAVEVAAKVAAQPIGER
jgi:hypothetical protein